LRGNEMKRLLRIFDLSKSEQRVVLLIVLALLVGAFAAYERRVHQYRVQPRSAMEPKGSPSPAESEEDR
jgi:hypothetical protein